MMIGRLGRARALGVVLLAAGLTGCVGTRFVEVSQPVSTGLRAAPAAPGERVAVHVVRHWTDPASTKPSAAELGIASKYRTQLSALGYQVISPAEATNRDLLIRVDVRQHAGGSGGESMTITLAIFSAFILPVVTSEHLMLDTTLIRDGELLGASRQTIKKRHVMSFVPLALLHGGPEGTRHYETSAELNTELLALAQRPRAGGL